MADGTRQPIEDVDVDGQIMAVDPGTGKAGARPVLALVTGTATRPSSTSPSTWTGTRQPTAR